MVPGRPLETETQPVGHITLVRLPRLFLTLLTGPSLGPFRAHTEDAVQQKVVELKFLSSSRASSLNERKVCRALQTVCHVSGDAI